MFIEVESEVISDLLFCATMLCMTFGYFGYRLFAKHVDRETSERKINLLADVFNENKTFMREMGCSVMNLTNKVWNDCYGYYKFRAAGHYVSSCLEKIFTPLFEFFSKYFTCKTETCASYCPKVGPTCFVKPPCPTGFDCFGAGANNLCEPFPTCRQPSFGSCPMCPLDAPSLASASRGPHQEAPSLASASRGPQGLYGMRGPTDRPQVPLYKDNGFVGALSGRSSPVPRRRFGASGRSSPVPRRRFGASGSSSPVPQRRNLGQTCSGTSTFFSPDCTPSPHTQRSLRQNNLTSKKCGNDLADSLNCKLTCGELLNTNALNEYFKSYASNFADTFINTCGTGKYVDGVSPETDGIRVYGTTYPTTGTCPVTGTPCPTTGVCPVTGTPCARQEFSGKNTECESQCTEVCDDSIKTFMNVANQYDDPNCSPLDMTNMKPSDVLTEIGEYADKLGMTLNYCGVNLFDTSKYTTPNQSLADLIRLICLLSAGPEKYNKYCSTDSNPANGTTCVECSVACMGNETSETNEICDVDDTTCSSDEEEVCSPALTDSDQESTNERSDNTEENNQWTSENREPCSRLSRSPEEVLEQNFSRTGTCQDSGAN